MESSKETLDKCASAGEVFGNVLGGALQLVLTPAKMLLDTLAWILEKLGVLPDEAERARKKIEDAQRAAILQDKVALFQGDIAKINPPKSAENGNGTGGDKPKDNKPLTDSNTGTLRRLSKIADNTGKLVDETKNALALAILSLRTCPAHLLFVGSGRSGRLRRSVSLPPQLRSHPWSRLRCLRRWSLLLRPAPAQWRRPYDRQWHQFLQLPVTGSLLPPDLAVKFMFICITLLRRIPANWRNWSVKWSGQK